MKKSTQILVAGCFALAAAAVFALGGRNTAIAQSAGSGDIVPIYFFHSDACPHCVKEQAFLNELEQRRGDVAIQRFEMSDSESRRFYQEYGAAGGVAKETLAQELIPLTVIDGEYYVLGFQDAQIEGRQIETDIDRAKAGVAAPENTRRGAALFGHTVLISESTPLTLAAVIFGLADGINPCMFSVLLIMLAYLLAASGTKKAVWSGTLFAACVFAIYLLFMVGIYKSLVLFGAGLAGSIAAIKMVLGAVFVAVGLWMAKDYFFLKEGQKVSFAIPKAAHPLIKKLAAGSSAGAVILLAAFSSLVELPCTFALPLGFTAILAERGVLPYPYLLLYNLFFVLPLLVIVAALGFGFSRVERMEKWREKTKTVMRLASGLLLAFLGIAFLIMIF